MTLKSKLAATGLGMMLFFGGSIAPVEAQEVAQAAEEEDEGFDDWGLLGLLGLLGLAGLKRRDDHRTVSTTETRATNR